MSFYENVFIARQDISTNQVEALAEALATIISENGGQVTVNNELRYNTFQVQNNYQQQIEAYKQLYNQNLQEIQRAKDGFIPAEGPSVPVEGMYETVMGSNGQAKSQRVQIPQSSIKWLIEQLQAQKIGFGQIQSLPQGQQASMAQAYNQGTEMPEGQVNGNR